MTAQFVRLGDRRFVNSDFISEVRKLYPATTSKIPLGFSTYVGWTGKDLVLFTQHDPVGGLQGVVYEVTTNPVKPEAFDVKILKLVKHRELKAASEAPTETVAAPQPTVHVARAAQGLYGYARLIQACCEVSTKRLNMRARDLMRKAVRRDEAVLTFLQQHVRKGRDLSARVLLSAYRESLPKIAGVEVTAAAPKLGMYGFPVRTATLGLQLCASLRELAGILAADLHTRKASLHPKITGFLDVHSKTAKCASSRLILSCYPDPGFKFRRRMAAPKTVDEWLSLPADALKD
jgi:hypothetical protein